jgi:hypothetical protein
VGPIRYILSALPYSYGDSAGFSPDFPFNPAGAGTKSATNVMREMFSQEIVFSSVGNWDTDKRLRE